MVISPSLHNRIGHYHDYAMRLIAAADGLGRDGRLATHLDHGVGDARVGPFFRRTCEFTQQGAAARGFGVERLQRPMARLRDRLRGGARIAPAVAAFGPADASRPQRTTPAAQLFGIWRRVANALSDHLSRHEFTTDLDDLLDNLAARTGDIAFLADAGLCELQGLAQRINAPSARALNWAVMLRRDVTEQQGGRWSPEDWARALRNLAAAGGDRVRLYSDTESLARAHAALSGVSVGCLPIPVVPAVRRPRGATFQATYLGDARDEKGFPLLVEAIEGLAAEREAGTMRFVLQSHFNSATGDPRTALALARLGQDAPGVALVGRALDADAYSTLLGEADAIVLPYEPEAYRLRSSGVLVEALASGVPVVVTAGSWLADQVQPHEQAYLAEQRSRSVLIDPVDDVVALDEASTGETVVLTIASHAIDPQRADLTLVITGANGERQLSQVRVFTGGLLFAVPLEPGDFSVRLASSPNLVLTSAFRLPAGAPRSAVGMIASPTPAAVQEAIQELARARNHYLETAREASTDWARRTTARALVAQIVDDARTPA